MAIAVMVVKVARHTAIRATLRMGAALRAVQVALTAAEVVAVAAVTAEAIRVADSFKLQLLQL